MAQKTIFYGIGDVHGMIDHFKAICEWIVADAAARGCDAHAIQCGDLIDRGPRSREVVRYARTEAPAMLAGYTQLRGNHEEAMVYAIDNPQDAQSVSWLYHHGQECLSSYGIDIGVATRRRDPVGPEIEGLAALLDDVEWMADLPLQAVVGDNLFCHAGIDPTRHPEEQKERIILWGDPAFRRALNNDGSVLHPAYGATRVVHGHYPVHTGPEVTRHRINLDTACCFKGPLTCAAFDGPGAPVRVAQARRASAGLFVRTRTIPNQPTDATRPT